MKKTIYPLVASFLLVAFVLTACGTSPQPVAPTQEQNISPTQNQAAAAAPLATNPAGEKPTLHMMAAVGGSSTAFIAAAQDYEAKTGVKVDVQVYAYADLHDAQIMALRNKSTALDVVVVDGSIWMAELNPFLVPLDPYLAKDNVDKSIYVPTMLDSMAVKTGTQTTIFGLPIRVAPWVLIYRADLFKDKGLNPPKTMGDFLNAAQALTGNGTYGFAASFKQGNYLVNQWMPFLYSFGGNILNEDMTKAAFNNDAGKKSLQFLVDLYNKYNVIPPSAIDAEQGGIITSMQQGLTAMAITYAPYYLNINDPKLTKFSGNFAVAPFMPYDEGSGLSAGVTEISGWGFAINQSSVNKDLAWDFIKFVGGATEQEKLATQNANSPTIESIFGLPDYVKIYPSASQVLSIAMVARKRPGTPHWTQVEDILAKAVSSAISGEKTVEQNLADAEKDVNSALASSQ